MRSSTARTTGFTRSDRLVGKPPLQSRTAQAKRLSAYLPWIILLSVMTFAAIMRIRLLSIPLDRDEGEYAYMGRMLMEGVPPYVHAYSMKLPGIYVVYALIMAIFGQTDVGVHLGLVFVNALSALLIFLLTRRLFDAYSGVVASTSFLIFTLSPSVHGLIANAEHFMLPLALGGILLMLRAADSGRALTIFLSGLLLGLAFVTKQHGFFFLPFALGYYLWDRWRKGRAASGSVTRTALFLVGALAPYALICLAYYALGEFDKFWWWTFTVANMYASRLTIREGVAMFALMAPLVFPISLALWGLAVAGLAATLANAEIRRKRVFVLGFTFFSLLSVLPGFYFREHYFILLLPAASLLVALTISTIRRLLRRTGVKLLWECAPALLVIAAFGHSLWNEAGFLFVATPVEASRLLHGGNPFPEAVEVGKYIREHTKRNDLVAVLGSEPELLFYAQRRSATGYIYTYPLMYEDAYAPGMQREMIREVEAAKPKILVFVSVPTSWGKREHSDTHIFRWSTAYSKKFYRTVGVVDIVTFQCTDYIWGEDAEGFLPPQDRPVLLLYIFERKS